LSESQTRSRVRRVAVCSEPVDCTRGLCIATGVRGSAHFLKQIEQSSQSCGPDDAFRLLSGGFPDVETNGRLSVLLPGMRRVSRRGDSDHVLHSHAIRDDTRMTERTRRSCSCGGSNENCQRCFGSGWVDNVSPVGGFGSTAGAHRAQPGATLPSFTIPVPEAAKSIGYFGSSRRRRRRKPKRLLSCVVCGKWMLTERLARHAARCPGQRVAKPSAEPRATATAAAAPFNQIKIPAAVSTAASGWLRCKFCGDKVRSDGAAKHLRQVHGDRFLATSPVRAAADEKVKCPYCKRRIHVSGVMQHARSKHPGLRPPTVVGSDRVRRAKQPKHPPRAITPGEERPTLPSDGDGGRTERLLDGTRGQHVFRELGRFGSASSHDKYDDESDA